MTDKLRFAWNIVPLTPPIEVFIAFEDGKPLQGTAHAVATLLSETLVDAEPGDRLLRAVRDDFDPSLELFPDEAETRWLVPQTLDAWSGGGGGWVSGSEIRFSRQAAEELSEQLRRRAESLDSQARDTKRSEHP